MDGFRRSIASYLQRLAKLTLETQGKVIAWSLDTDEDLDALEEDVIGLMDWANDIHDLILEERSRRGSS